MKRLLIEIVPETIYRDGQDKKHYPIINCHVYAEQITTMDNARAHFVTEEFPEHPGFKDKKEAQAWVEEWLDDQKNCKLFYNKLIA